MGLTKENMVVFPTIEQSESMACVENNGQLRYLNGLDEFAPEIKAITNPKVKEAKIREIRETVARLEKEVALNGGLNVDDPDFWNKVTMFKPNNTAVFGKIKLVCSNDEVTLNPVDKYEDLLIIKAIEAGGFSLVAKSYEDLISGKTTRKWFLDKEVETMNVHVNPIKLKNKAIALFDELYEKNYNKLFYICKLIMVRSIIYTKRTLNDTIYKDVNDFLNGLHQEKEIGSAAKTFLDTAELSMEDLKIKAAIKDLIYTKDIVHKSDGMLYVNKLNAPLGRTINEALEFYKNPANDDMLRMLLEGADKLWSA